MFSTSKLAAVAAAFSMLISIPHAAQAQAVPTDAVKLRQLDIMLMVTSLRCRFGADNFQADYAQFSTSQNATMRDAYRAMQADYTRQHGAAGAKRALDTISVGMANQYGVGHPWLGCSDLKSMTRDLAATTDRARLIAVADEVLAASPRTDGILLATRR